MKLKEDPFVAFAHQVAYLDAEGDLTEETGEDGVPTEYVMENDDAWATLNGLIHEARALLEASKWTLRGALRATVIKAVRWCFLGSGAVTRDQLLAELTSWAADYYEAFGKRDEDGSYRDADVNWDAVHAAEDRAVALAQDVLAMLGDGQL